MLCQRMLSLGSITTHSSFTRISKFIACILSEFVLWKCPSRAIRERMAKWKVYLWEP
jgi:hypothetical protein